MAKKAKPKAVKGQGRVTAQAPTAPKASAKKSTTPKRATKGPSTVPSNTGTKYIRNLHYGAGGARIDLDHVDMRIHLEPRGQRGDMRLSTEQMQEDPMYQHNLGLLFEEISVEQGRAIIAKQSHNAQQSGPSTMDMLTNEFGEKYTQTRASIMPSDTEQAVTVGHIVPERDGKNTERNVDIERQAQPTDFFGNGQASTRPALGPEEVQVPGSRPVFNPDILPAGLNTEQAILFIQTPREDREALVAQWHRLAVEGENYRNELNLEVGEVEYEEEE